MSVTDDHRKSATRSRKVVHPPSPSSDVILCAGAFQPERRISRALYPRPEAKRCRGRAVTFASFSTGVILSGGAFQPERRISRALYPRPEAKGCRGRAVTFASFSTGVILSGGAFQPERRILRGTASAAGANESRVDRTRAPRRRNLPWNRSHLHPSRPASS